MPRKSWSTAPSGLRKRTSAIPSPSVPGSHAATNALEALSCGFTHSGRPERKTETTGMPSARRRRSSFEIGIARGAEGEVGYVALEFRIGILAIDDDSDVRLAFECAVGTQIGLAAGGVHRTLDALPDRLPVREVLVGGARALPGQRPAAALLRDVVGAVAGDEHPLARPKRQQVILVLQQHQRLAHRAAGDGAVPRRAQQVEVPCERPRGRRPFREEPVAQLHSQDPPDRIVQARARDLPGAHLRAACWRRAPSSRSAP